MCPHLRKATNCWVTSRLEDHEGQGSAITPIQGFGSAEDLGLHPCCLVSDGVCRGGADGAPTLLVEEGVSSGDGPRALRRTVIPAS
jgi:hypothetical protein